MNIRNVLVGLVAVGSLAFVGACGDSDDAGSGTPSTTAGTSAPAANPVDTVKASTRDFAKTPYRYSFKTPANGVDVNGSIDPSSGAHTMAAAVLIEGVSIQFNVIAAGADYYAKIAGVSIPGINAAKYYHVDTAKLKSADALLMSDYKDPTGAQGLTRSVVTAEKTGDRMYRGTMDLTQAGSVAALSTEDLKAYADRAKSMPFEATLDGNGRLTSLKLMIPAGGDVKADTFAYTYTDFGAAVTATKPAADQVLEASPTVYELLNS